MSATGNEVVKLSQLKGTTDAIKSSINNVLQVAQGKTKTYVLANQSAITGTKASDGSYTNVTAITGITLSDLAIGDIILIIDTEVPDLWVSQLTPSVTLSKLETTKVDLTGYVQTTRKVNNKALSSDITLNASDVNALPSNTSYVSSVNGSSGAITNIATTSELENKANKVDSFYFVTGSSSRAGATNLSTKWEGTISGVSTAYDGLKIAYRINTNTGVGTYGAILSIDGTNYYPVVFNKNSIIGSRYAVGSTISLVFNSTQTATGYDYVDGTAQAKTYTGCWQMEDYDTTTTDARRTYDYNFRPYVSANKLYRYKLCGIDKDNRLVPIVNTNQTSATQVAKTPTSVPMKLDNIWFYNSTTDVNASTVVTARVLASQGYFDNMCQYNFNDSIPTYRMIYLRGNYDHTTGLFTLYNDGTSPCTSYYVGVPCKSANITLSSYFTSGYYYWLVGATYSTADYLQLFANNPLYYFDGTNLVPYTSQGGSGGTSDFDELTNRPSYNGSVMTHSTNIPEVKTATWDGKQNAITSSNKLSASLVSGLSNVATSGSYDDLSNKPTIPSAVTESTVSGWGFTKNTGTVSSLGDLGITATATELNYTDGVTSNIQTQLNGKQATITSSNKLSTSLISGLSNVATSGSYNDLSNTPTIPTVSDATITINQGGTQKGTFTLNGSATTINLDAGGSIPNNIATYQGQSSGCVISWSGENTAPDWILTTTNADAGNTNKYCSIANLKATMGVPTFTLNGTTLIIS